MVWEKNPCRARRPKEQVMMNMGQFCLWLAKEKGCSAEGLKVAMNLVSQGMMLALARGYKIQWRGWFTMELREMAGRKRYHRIRKEIYDAPPFVRVHFSAAEDLNKHVRALAAKEVDNAVRNLSLTHPTVD